jgi:PAS domain S-box-containing protein
MVSTPIPEIPHPPLLALRDVSLDYGSVNALRNVSLVIRPGEIHAIVGEHGAGKSSLAKVASGMLKPKEGQLVFEGTVYGELTAARARSLGIEMVYQEMQIFDNLTVAEHFFLLPWSAPAFPQFLLAKRQAAKVADFLRSLGLAIDPLARLENLSRADQLLVDIAKSLFHKPKLLILDEVFERISAFDLNRFLPFLRRQKDDGMSIILVTHKIDDVYEFADSVSIVKEGEILLTGPVTDIDKMNLITLTYTQISKEEQSEDRGREFYTYLRYNEAILQFLPVILMVIDREGLVKMVNVSACEYFHVTRKECLRVPFDALFGARNAETVSTIRRTLSARQKKTFYSVPLILSGRKSVVNLIVYPIRDGSHPIGHMIIIEDLTEQEQLRTQLILSEKLASVGLLAAGVAHEINNPLGIITNYLQSIKFRFGDAELRTRIGAVEEQIQFISTIVSDLLLFSDSGRVVREEINIVEVIRGLIGFVQYSFRHSDIAITLTSARDSIIIAANQNEIKQIMLNLMKNSFEAMPKGGTIDIAVQEGEREGVPAVVVRVRDSGPGIAHENPNDVFLPFYSTKRGEDLQHMGLGLSVTYGIVKKYDGEISVENLQTAGCEFTISLPLKRMRQVV